MEKKIIAGLKTVLEEMGIKRVEPQVEHPADSGHGDYASNIAMAIFSSSKFKVQSSKFGSPLELAQEIAKRLEVSGKQLGVDKIGVAKPGFINFWLSNEYLQNQVHEIVKQGDSYGSLNLGKGKKARVEYVSANPTGPLHFGNARGGPIGDVLANVLEFAGYRVLREYYNNNVGGQIKKLGESVANIKAGGKLEDQEYKGHYVAEIAEKMGPFKDADDAGKKTVERLLEGIIKDCKDMGINFDKIYHESEFIESGRTKETLKKVEKFLRKQNGALWFAPSDEFLKDRETVVVKSDGTYTYFANDIAYHDLKFDDSEFGKPDMVIDILGANHHGHVPRLQAAVKALGHEVSNFHVILYQWVRFINLETLELLTMSKRLGTFVSAREVLDAVGKDVVRFFMLMHRPETHMDFDLALAMKKANENPVFYVQYAHARIQSVFKKAGERIEFSQGNFSLLTQKEELALLRKLIKLPELVEEISEDFGVNKLTTYAIEIADLFHRFYERHKVISDKKELTLARLGLLRATQIVLKNTLDLLGISAPERM